MVLLFGFFFAKKHANTHNDTNGIYPQHYR